MLSCGSKPFCRYSPLSCFSSSLSVFSVSKAFCWFNTTLIAKENINHNTLLFTFQLPKDKEDVKVLIGQNLSIRSPATDSSPSVQRAYTPLLPLKEDGTLKMVIKVYERGGLTQHLSSLEIGHSVQMKGPKGRFTSDFLSYGDHNTPKSLCMIAGGSGITPMLQLIRAMYYRKSLEARECSLIFANQTQSDILFKDELNDYAARFPQFQVHYFIEEQEPETNITSNTSVGRFDAPFLEKFFPKAGQNSPLLLLCGPFAMNKSAKEIAKTELSWPKENIFVF